MSRQEVSKDFADVWFSLFVGDDDMPPPSVGRWYLVAVTDYAKQRREYDAWYQATVGGREYALVGNAQPRVSLAKIPGGYHVKCDGKYINVTPDMVDDAVFVLCSDVLDMEGDE